MKKSFRNTLLIYSIIFVFFQILIVGIIGGINVNKMTKQINEKQIENQNGEVDQINITFKSSKYELYGEIYFPKDDTKTYPCIVFCEGIPAYVSAYSWLPKVLAEEGYVVMIFDPPGLGKSEGNFPIIISISVPAFNMFYRFGSYSEGYVHYYKHEWTQSISDALTYMLEESPVKHLINNSAIGAIGHSLGGIAVTEVAVEDERFDAIVAMSHGNPRIIKNVDMPIQFISGGFDLGVNSIPMTLSSYKRASTPKELIMIQLGTHFGFTTTFNKFCPCPAWQKEIIIKYSVGWFNYFLKNQISAYETITTGTEHLSKFFKSKYDFGDGERTLNN